MITKQRSINKIMILNVINKTFCASLLNIVIIYYVLLASVVELVIKLII